MTNPALSGPLVIEFGDSEWLRSESDRLLLRAWHTVNKARLAVRHATERDAAARQVCDDARIARLEQLWSEP
jgi:hypothetical protein